MSVPAILGVLPPAGASSLLLLHEPSDDLTSALAEPITPEERSVAEALPIPANAFAQDLRRRPSAPIPEIAKHYVCRLPGGWAPYPLSRPLERRC